MGVKEIERFLEQWQMDAPICAGGCFRRPRPESVKGGTLSGS